MRFLLYIKCIISFIINAFILSPSCRCLQFKNGILCNSPLFSSNNHRYNYGFIILNTPTKLHEAERCRRFRNDNCVLASSFSEDLSNNKTAWIPPPSKKIYNILAIETSFDDTCTAIVNSNGDILAEERVSQGTFTQKFGGMKPSESVIIHRSRIHSVIEKVLKCAGLSMNDISQIAVTKGPGVEICLRVGYVVAVELSKKYNIELIAENHIAAHCLSPMIKHNQFKHSPNSDPQLTKELKYPFLSLLVSGGHSQIYVVESPIRFHLIADTQDQNAGNTLDKCARELGMSLLNSGAAELECAAENVCHSLYDITTPSEHNPFIQFCFSGIQSQLTMKIVELTRKYGVNSVRDLSPTVINQLAYTTQHAVFKQIITQLEKAMDISECLFGINKLVLVGGVARNKRLMRMIIDTFENRDLYKHSRAHSFCEKMLVYIKKYRKNGEIYNYKNEYVTFEKLREYIPMNKTLDDLLKSLWDPHLLPRILFERVDMRISNKEKGNFYRAIHDVYFSLIGKEKLLNLKDGLASALQNNTIIQPSLKILNKLSDMEKDHSHLIANRINGITKRDGKWELFTTSQKYSIDNAVMICSGLLEKHKMGLNGIIDRGEINGKDVLPKWDLGVRRHWELLVNISKLESIISE